MVFAVVASALAAYASLHLTWIASTALRRSWPEIADDIWEAGAFLCLGVFFGTFWLMVMGIDAMQRERTKAEIEQRVRDRDVLAMSGKSK